MSPKTKAILIRSKKKRMMIEMLKVDDIKEMSPALTPKKVIEYFFQAHYTVNSNNY